MPFKNIISNNLKSVVCMCVLLSIDFSLQLQLQVFWCPSIPASLGINRIRFLSILRTKVQSGWSSSSLLFNCCMGETLLMQ